MVPDARSYTGGMFRCERCDEWWGERADEEGGETVAFMTSALPSSCAVT